jgi:hypothetical protein
MPKENFQLSTTISDRINKHKEKLRICIITIFWQIKVVNRMIDKVR